MYWNLFWSHLEASDGLSRLSPPAVGDSNLRNGDKACDKIDYSES